MGAVFGYMQWRTFRRINIDGVKWFWYAVLGITIPILIYDRLHLSINFELRYYLIPVWARLGLESWGYFLEKILRTD